MSVYFKCMLLKSRLIQNGIIDLHAKDRGRLLVLTGARQTGKSTLAQLAFPDYPVINLDAPVEREAYARMSPEQLMVRFPRAVLDEAQKLPEIFETVKAAYDRSEEVRYVLLGSSQILLMDRVRETLAGRVALRELFPFSLPELMLDQEGVAPAPSALTAALGAGAPGEVLSKLAAPHRSVSEQAARAAIAWEAFGRWGGMPPLHTRGWGDEDRFEWLQDYQATYLQRDLRDLARLSRLEPFVRAQRAAALRTAQTVNFSDLGRFAGVSPPTAREFLRYLEISYQVVLLPGWHRNLEKRLVKQPKLHFLDPGVRRAILRQRGEIGGAEFESAVVAEVLKQIRTARLPLDPFHLRTTDGREVDLVLEREDGYVALECKQAAKVVPSDFRHLRGLGQILDKPLLAGAVVSEDPECARVSGGDGPLFKLWAPALLGMPPEE